jgi:hypothetical protein
LLSVSVVGWIIIIYLVVTEIKMISSLLNSGVPKVTRRPILEICTLVRREQPAQNNAEYNIIIIEFFIVLWFLFFLCYIFISIIRITLNPYITVVKCIIILLPNKITLHSIFLSGI